MKHFAALMLTLILLSASSFALAAEGTPQSQFGFKGWPYRQTTDCTNDEYNPEAASRQGVTKCYTAHVNGSAAPAVSTGDYTTISAPAQEQKEWNLPDQTPAAQVQTPSSRNNSGYRWMRRYLYSSAPAQPTVSRPVISQPVVSQPVASQPTVSQPVVSQPQAETPAQGQAYSFAPTAQEALLFNLINKDRAANGLSALPLDGQLSSIARVKSQDMRDNHYFAHESPTYGNASQMLRTFGYSYRGVGENIAHYSDVEKAEAAFMSSQGHRHNLLGSQWEKVGVGVALDEYGFVYVTELFAR